MYFCGRTKLLLVIAIKFSGYDILSVLFIVDVILLQLEVHFVLDDLI